MYQIEIEYKIKTIIRREEKEEKRKEMLQEEIMPEHLHVQSAQRAVEAAVEGVSCPLG